MWEEEYEDYLLLKCKVCPDQRKKDEEQTICSEVKSDGEMNKSEEKQNVKKRDELQKPTQLKLRVAMLNIILVVGLSMIIVELAIIIAMLND